jgi:FixJ family two-component response regulator
MNPPATYVVSSDFAFGDSLRELAETEHIHVVILPSLAAFSAALEQGAHGCLVLDIQEDDWLDRKGQPGLVDACARMPTLILTDRGDVATAVRALKSGAVDVIEKPLRNSRLLQMINKLLRMDHGS